MADNTITKGTVATINGEEYVAVVVEEIIFDRYKVIWEKIDYKTGNRDRIENEFRVPRS